MYIAEKGREGCIQLKTGRELRKKKLKFQEKKNDFILMIGTMNLFSNLVKKIPVVFHIVSSFTIFPDIFPIFPGIQLE